MPTAKLCFMLGEIEFASQERMPQEGDEHENQAADEHRAQALLPADPHGRQAEGDEGVLAHVGSHGDGPVGVESHEQRAEGGGQDGGHGARTRGMPAKLRMAGLTTMM